MQLVMFRDQGPWFRGMGFGSGFRRGPCDSILELEALGKIRQNLQQANC